MQIPRQTNLNQNVHQNESSLSNMNPISCNSNQRNNPNRPKRVEAGRSRGGSSPRTRPSNPRLSAVSIARNSLYIDDATVNAMMSNIESFGSVNYAQVFAPSRFGPMRMPPMQRSHYPMEQQDSFGSHIDCNLNWVPKDLNITDLLEHARQEGSRCKKSEQKNALTIDLNDEPPKKDPRFLLNNLDIEEKPNEQIKKAKRESIMEWFDRTVEKELKQRRQAASCSASGTVIDPALVEEKSKNLLNMSKAAVGRLAEASAAEVEVTLEQAMEPDSELKDAVEQLAKAEAMCIFAGAVKAAEAAAELVPPAQAEEAAAASARCYQTCTSPVHEVIPGAKPIEVIGYIGITKPNQTNK